MPKKYLKGEQAFTLIELLVVIGIIAVLAAIVLVAVNPARQFAQARNSERASDLNALLNAIGERLVDNKGSFAVASTTCDQAIPTATSTIGTATTTVATTTPPNFNLEPCLVPDYLAAIPFDPKTGDTASTSYRIVENPASGRITVEAATPELGTTISFTR